MINVGRSIYKGLMTIRSADELPIGFCADSLNADLASSSSATQLKGYSEYGYQENPNDKIVRKYTYSRGQDTEVQLQVRDDGTNFIVEYLNKEDVRNSAKGQWCILEAGLSRIVTLLDASTKEANFGFAPFNDTGTNQLVYGNGVEAMRIWNGATAEIDSTTSNTITISGTRTWTQRGFSATGSLIINGTAYAYTGGAGTTTLTGVTSDPTGEADGSGAAQLVDSTTLSGEDFGSVLISAQGRLFLAGISNTPNQVTFSDVGDITSYSGGDPSSGGFEDFPQLNGDITGLAEMDNWIVVFSKFKIVAFKFQFPSSTTRTVIRKEIADEGCVNPKAIQKIGNRVIYITPAGGFKQITQVSDKDIFQVDDLTEFIRPTIKNWVWDDACLIYSPRDKILIGAGQSNDTIGINDKAVTIQFSVDEQGQLSTNMGIIDWFINDGTFYDNKLHFGSSVSSRNFLAFDGYSKNGAPYIWRRTERIEIFDDRWTKKHIQFLGVSGSLSSGSTLKIKLKYGLNGSLSTQEMQIAYDDDDFIVQSALNVLGGFQLGTEPLGGTNEDIGEGNAFEVFFELPHIYSRIFQVEFSSDGAGQNISLDSHCFVVEDAGQKITQDEIKELGN